MRDLDLRGNLVADAAVAALCIEHGLEVVSADTDFARFPEVVWVNPTAVAALAVGVVGGGLVLLRRKPTLARKVAR